MLFRSTKVYSASTIASTCQTWVTSSSRFYSTITTTRLLDISVRTGLLTIDLIRPSYVWPELRNSIKSYIKSCTSCMRSKPQRHRPYRLLKQLLIPEQPWNSISMDFIEKLPSSSGFDTILVIVDWLTKQSIFIPTVDTINAQLLAKLFVLHFSPSTEFHHTLPPTKAWSLFHPFSRLSIRP